MLDPIDVGMQIHASLMARIGKYVVDPEEFLAIARMTDCLVGSAQVHAVENGLDMPPQQYRSHIQEKLESLGMMPTQHPSPAPPIPSVPPMENLSPCLCSMNSDGHCAVCSAGLTTWLNAFAKLQATYVKKLDDIGSLSDSASCRRCVAKYADVTIAKAFFSTFQEISAQNVVAPMFNAMKQAASTLGAAQTPLLNKAYADLCRERGW